MTANEMLNLLLEARWTCLTAEDLETHTNRLLGALIGHLALLGDEGESALRAALAVADPMWNSL